MTDESWVFDSLICFLHSPAWNAALSTFIEEKSLSKLYINCSRDLNFPFQLVFDPNIDIDISNQEYVTIFDQYKNLVDYMLGSFMEEMNITPEQFEIACLEGKNLTALNSDESADSHSFSFHKGLFQQIWAANDIRIFVRLMVQRNVEIQLQALDLIERRQASFADSENGDVAPQRNIESNEFENIVAAEVNSDSREGSEVTNQTDSDDKFKRLNLFFEQRTNTADIAERQQYLRAQRDKILQIKKQTRARQLNEATKDRPTSARAAQKVIDGETVSGDESSIQLRKLLARKLRDEVVDKTDGI